jgi:TonB family protein
MISCLLKKALPFTLTFIIGATVGGLFRSHRSYEATWDWHARAVPLGPEVPYGRHDHCRMHRRYLLDESRQVVIISQPAAIYTTMAKRHGQTGIVSLRVTFGADGTIKDVSPLKSLPYGLTESAESAAWQIRFTPATENSVPISVTKTIEFDFPSEQTEDESSLAAPMPMSEPFRFSGTR